MKIALYGMPCAGKTTLLSSLSNARFVSGSDTLKKLSNNTFHSLSESEKYKIRIEYAAYLDTLSDEVIISDGHYSFLDDVVFTEADANVYDVFIYLYCPAKTLKERIRSSSKNERFAYLPVSRLEQWQLFEIECLREECHKRCKDFYVINDNPTSDYFSHFVEMIKNGYSSYGSAIELVEKIKKLFPSPCEISLVDGDKTLIKQDSFRVCGNHNTTVFDGNFYTGYQALRFTEETSGLQYNYDKLNGITINNIVYDKIKDSSYVVISAGIAELWNKITDRLKIKNVFASTQYSADTKYYAVKLLQKEGYKVVAYGDSKNDYYMLKSADIGYLYLGNRLSRSLHNVDLAGVALLYDKSPYILSEYDKSVDDEIEICKSNSGVNGSRLALAHLSLGQKIGGWLADFIPNKNTAVIVLERGGRFFGDGVYCKFGGVFYPYNSNNENFPTLHQPSTIVLIDSVINTGKTILALIEKIKEKNPCTEVVIVSNVIQRKALIKLRNYKIVSVRVSDNFFIGEKQQHQTGTKGPDTADRLFNLI